MKILRSLTDLLPIPFFVLVVFSLSMSSCRTERIAILKDIPDTASVRYVPLPTFTPPVVQPDDILNIVIQTLDPQANTILNQGNLPINSGAVTGGNVSTTSSQSVVAGYLVTKDGYIRMPYIGVVKV